MGVDIRQFSCVKPSCTGKMEFDIVDAARNSGNYAVSCPKCNKKWNITIERSSCCRIFVRFSSIEIGNKKSIVKVKSIAKRKR